MAQSARQLNAKEERFVAEVLAGKSGAEAARNAGFSVKRADQTAYKIARRTPIAAGS